MSKIDFRRPRLGAVVQFEDKKEYGYCRKIVTVNEVVDVEYVAGGVISTAGTHAVVGTTFDGIYVGSPYGDDYQVVKAGVPTEVVVLYRGPAGVGKANLLFGPDVDTDAEKEVFYAQMEAAGIQVIEQV